MSSIFDHETRRRLENRLENAVRRTSSTGASWEVHIDELSPRLRNKHSWIAGGLELLELIANTPAVREASYVACLVIHLDPGATAAGIGVEDVSEQWSESLGVTPPELALYGPKDWSVRAKYLQDFGRALGNLSVGSSRATVRLTERIEHYGTEVAPVRHIWTVVGRV